MGLVGGGRRVEPPAWRAAFPERLHAVVTWPVTGFVATDPGYRAGAGPDVPATTSKEGDRSMSTDVDVQPTMRPGTTTDLVAS